MRKEAEHLFSRLLAIVENNKAKMADRLKAQEEIKHILRSFPVIKSDREEVMRRNQIPQLVAHGG